MDLLGNEVLNQHKLGVEVRATIDIEIVAVISRPSGSQNLAQVEIRKAITDGTVVAVSEIVIADFPQETRVEEEKAGIECLYDRNGGRSDDTQIMHTVSSNNKVECVLLMCGSGKQCSGG